MVAVIIGYHLTRRPELALVVVNLALEVLATEEPITSSPAGKTGGAFSSPAREASSCVRRVLALKEVHVLNCP